MSTENLTIRRRIMLADSFNRLAVLLDSFPVRPPQSRLASWFALLGEEWSGCDTISLHRHRLASLFRRHRLHWRCMMNLEEQAAFDSLPERVLAYRGCGIQNRFGLSWTLSREVAEKFPRLNRYMQAMPLLITAEIPKKRIIALKLDREEFELIALIDHRDILIQENISGGKEPRA
jgi:hypothetical protein